VVVVNIQNSSMSYSEATQGTQANQEDTVVASVVASFQERSRAGQLKYGTTLDRTDLSPLQWAQHLQEELMDAILYLERLKREISARDLQHQI
jgi:hypothetical protein